MLAWPASVSTFATTSATSRKSVVLTVPLPAGITIWPVALIRGAEALKFCMKKVGRIMVHFIPDARMCASAATWYCVIELVDSGTDSIEDR